MKTSVIEVRDMLLVLSVPGVEKRIGKVPGVESVTVNFAAGTATVRYDETRLDIADIRSDVRQSGYGTDSAPGASPGKGHEGPGVPRACSMAAIIARAAADPSGSGAVMWNESLVTEPPASSA